MFLSCWQAERGVSNRHDFNHSRWGICANARERCTERNARDLTNNLKIFKISAHLHRTRQYRHATHSLEHLHNNQYTSYILQEEKFWKHKSLKTDYSLYDMSITDVNPTGKNLGNTADAVTVEREAQAIKPAIQWLSTPAFQTVHHGRLCSFGSTSLATTNTRASKTSAKFFITCEHC